MSDLLKWIDARPEGTRRSGKLERWMRGHEDVRADVLHGVKNEGVAVLTAYQYLTQRLSCPIKSTTTLSKWLKAQGAYQ